MRAGEDDLDVLLTTSVFGTDVVCFRRAGVDSLEEVDFCAIHRCRKKESWSVLKEARLILFDFDVLTSLVHGQTVCTCRCAESISIWEGRVTW